MTDIMLGKTEVEVEKSFHISIQTLYIESIGVSKNLRNLFRYIIGLSRRRSKYYTPLLILGMKSGGVI